MSINTSLKFLPIAGLAVSTLLVVVLAASHRDLSNRHEELLRLATQPHPGMYVPAFDAATVDGDTVRIGEARPGQRQLLYFLTTSCPYCRASIPAWKELTRWAPDDISVVAVALDSAHLVEAYRRQQGLELPIIVLSDRRLRALYRVNRVPLTMVVDESGRVLAARIGELSGSAAVDSIRRAVSGHTIVDGSTQEPEGVAEPRSRSSDVRR